MKIRSGFVSNSSSSSFICDVCNVNRSGWDLELADAGMFSCMENHITCDKHFIGDIVDYDELNLEEKRMYILSATGNEDIKNKIIIAKNEEELNTIHCNTYYSKQNIPVKNCPCCTLNDVTNQQMVEFFLLNNKTTRDETIKKMRNSFKNYGELLRKLRRK